MIGPDRKRIESILWANTRIIAWVISLLLIADVTVAIRHGFSTSPSGNGKPSAQAGDGAGTPYGSTPYGAASASPTGSPTLASLIPASGRTLKAKPGPY